MSDNYYVEAVELDTFASISNQGPFSKVKAEEIAAGARAGLNRDKFVVRVEERNAFGHPIACPCLACGGY